ncbi:MAG: DUF2520 domain-containing protein [Dysgonamonadaceae bacterium]|nr:DUF2520 domain-containing protein [Dysgonamonadaceae bacterium]
MTKPDIVLIGAGNLATQLGMALKENGFPIVCVHSRTFSSAENLGKLLQVPYTNVPADIPSDAELYIFAVNDDALPELLKKIPANQGLWAHTAGSLPLSVFEGYANRFGVIYPLQTFNMQQKVDFGNIPVFIEANNRQDETVLLELARKLSGKVIPLCSEKRKYYHLAAVFACNFSNHMYTLASDILEKQDLDWRNLLPLIKETASKIETISPAKAQTGPAVRYDRTIIDKQIELLKDDKTKQTLYENISRSIHNMAIKT